MIACVAPRERGNCGMPAFHFSPSVLRWVRCGGILASIIRRLGRDAMDYPLRKNGLFNCHECFLFPEIVHFFDKENDNLIC